MRFKLEIQTDSPAFLNDSQQLTPYSLAQELKTVFDEQAISSIATGATSGKLLDTKGQPCGRWALVRE